MIKLQSEHVLQLRLIALFLSSLRGISCNHKVNRHMWGAEYEYKVPYVGWSTVTDPKKFGGSGIKHLGSWNEACVAKLVWAVAQKKDTL